MGKVEDSSRKYFENKNNWMLETLLKTRRPFLYIQKGFKR